MTVYLWQQIEKSMKYILPILLVFLSIPCLAQESTGEYTSDKEPIGEHTMTDADGNEYTILYTDDHLIRKISVISGENKYKAKLPKSIEKYKWNKIKDGLYTTLKTPKEGFETTFYPGKAFKVHYAGHLVDGKKFDSSFYRNEALEGTYARVIKGFALAMANMEVGDFAVFKISPELGYGERDLGIIPSNSTLLFYIYKIEEPAAEF